MQMWCVVEQMAIDYPLIMPMCMREVLVYYDIGYTARVENKTVLHIFTLTLSLRGPTLGVSRSPH